MIVEWRPKAQAQLTEQLEFIALDKPEAALRTGHLVIETCEMLADWPHMGKPIARSDSRMLAIPRTSFLVIYRIAADRIVITRFLHGAQLR